MRPATRRRILGVALAVYCIDLVWKLAHWNQFMSGLKWWMIITALNMRFAVMGFLFWQYRLAAKSLSQKAEGSE